MLAVASLRTGEGSNLRPLVLETNALPTELPDRVPKDVGGTLRGIVALTNKIFCAVISKSYRLPGLPGRRRCFVKYPCCP